MKIVSWNCNGALRKKLEIIDSLKADVLVVQECEDPAQSTRAYQDWAGNYVWHGDNKNKGIGIFAKASIELTPLNWNGTFTINGLQSKSPALSWSTQELKLFLPVRINDAFNLLGVWTKGKDDQVFGYMGQFWKYIQVHRSELEQSNTIIIGDFNSNAQWDKTDRWWNHSSVIAELKELGIESLYHQVKGYSQGDESEPTFFHQRKLNKGYHIDYALVSQELLAGSDLAIGNPEEWLEYSDHMPLICEIDTDT